MHEKFRVMNISRLKKKNAKFAKNTCMRKIDALQYVYLPPLFVYIDMFVGSKPMDSS